MAMKSLILRNSQKRERNKPELKQYVPFDGNLRTSSKMVSFSPTYACTKSVHLFNKCTYVGQGVMNLALVQSSAYGHPLELFNVRGASLICMLG